MSMKYPIPLVSFLVALAASSLNAVELGFLEDFERPAGPLADHPGEWAWDGLISLNIESGVGHGGSKGLSITTNADESGSLFLAGSTNWHPAVWNHFKGKLTPRSSDPAIDSSVRCAFYVTTGGGVRARDGGEWVDVELDSVLDLNALHYWSMKLDFVDQTWKLWVNDLSLTPSPLAFANAGDSSQGLRIDQDGAATSVIDEVSVTRKALSGLADLSDYTAFAGGIDWQGRDSSALGDANDNGVPNLVEYALGITNPGSPATFGGPGSPSSPIDTLTLDPVNNTITFTFQRRRGIEDVAVVPVISEDLAGWNLLPMDAGNLMITEIQANPAIDEITVTHPVPVDQTRAFVRLEVQ